MSLLSYLKWYPQPRSTNTNLCLPIGIRSAVDPQQWESALLVAAIYRWC